MGVEKNLDNILQKAKKVAGKSPCRFQIACILVDNDGDIVACGYNHRGKSHYTCGHWTTHAEANACKKVRKQSGNLKAVLFRHRGNPIHPCKSCKELLKSYNIREVWHTMGKGKVEKMVID